MAFEGPPEPRADPVRLNSLRLDPAAKTGRIIALHFQLS
jgi:hypothetical protein